MENRSYRLYSKIKREYKDPIYYDQYRTKYWNFLVDIKDLYRTTKGKIIYEANPREHEENNPPNNSVVKAIRNEFLEDTRQFHLKNSGITIIADSVQETGEDEFTIKVNAEKGGITNGGTTYRELMKVCKEKDLSELPNYQYVKVMVMEGIPSDWIADISGCLNSHAKVNQTAILNLDNKLDFIKNALDENSWSNEIAYKQHQPGEWSVDKIIQIMNLFDVIDYKPGNDSHPIQSYSSKSSVIKKLSERLKKIDQETKRENFHLMTPILKEILILHDTIRHEFTNYINLKKLYRNYDKGFWILNGKNSSGKKNISKYFLPTMDKGVDYDLSEAALFPILAAFRVCIDHSSRNDYMSWKLSFNAIKNIWRASAKKILIEIDEVYKAHGGNVSSIGKTRTAWRACISIVEDELKKVHKH